MTDKTDSAALIAGDTERVEVSQRAREAAAESLPDLPTAQKKIMSGEMDDRPVVQSYARFEHETRLAGERAERERAAGIAEGLEIAARDAFDFACAVNNLLTPLKSEWQQAGFWTEYDEMVFQWRPRVTMALEAALAQLEAIRAQAGEAS